MKWFANHTSEHTQPPLDKVIAWLHEQGVKEIGAVGYCFGGTFLVIIVSATRFVLMIFSFLGRYVFNLAFENRIKVGAVAHPSLLVIPQDLEVSLIM